MENKFWVVTIELDTVEIKVTAKDIHEARKKAIEKLKKKNVMSLISRHYHVNHRRKISVDRIS